LAIADNSATKRKKNSSVARESRAIVGRNFFRAQLVKTENSARDLSAKNFPQPENNACAARDLATECMFANLAK